jgi:hypothetical protein
MNTVREQGGADGLDSWRVEITPAQASANAHFMNVVYPTGAATNAMPAVNAVTAASGNMVGVQIEAGAEDIVVMFSSDPVGTPPTDAIIYDVGYNGLRSEHQLHNLISDTEYAVDVMAGPTSRTVVVSRGRGYRSSSEGILRFTLGSEPAVLSSLGTPIRSGVPGRR